MSGLKQFILELSNFLVNMVLMVIVMIAGNLVYSDIIEFSKEAVRIFNIALTIFFSLCLMLQNVFLKSFFYAIAKYKITSKSKINVMCHNFIFNVIIIGTIATQVCKIAYAIRILFIVLLILEFVPCFINKYSKSFSCYLFKITTIKVPPKKIENDGILL